MKKTKTIRYLAASERLNYGDLLFPIIFKHYFQNSFHFSNYGLISSDNSSFGALKTRSFRKLIRDIKKEDLLVIGGGQVFFPSWATLMSYIYSWYNRLYSLKVFRKFEAKTKLSAHLLGDGSYSPYLPKLQVPTYYNSVGGAFHQYFPTEVKEELKSCLKAAKSITVRDLWTFRSLQQENIEAKMVPDTAILLSRVFPSDGLSALSTQKARDINYKYVFLQVGLNKGPKDLERFIRQLSEVANEYSLKVLCCPIGLAPGHEDQVILKKMVSLSADWMYVEPENLYDIMYLIAHSSIYVGTSLHGAITAYSYLKPIVPLNRSILKLDSFVDTWTNDIYINSIDFEDIQIGVENAFQKWDQIKAASLLKEQQQMVLAHFEALKNSMKRHTISVECNHAA